MMKMASTLLALSIIQHSTSWAVVSASSTQAPSSTTTTDYRTSQRLSRRNPNTRKRAASLPPSQPAFQPQNRFGRSQRSRGYFGLVRENETDITENDVSESSDYSDTDYESNISEPSSPQSDLFKYEHEQEHDAYGMSTARRSSLDDINTISKEESRNSHRLIQIPLSLTLQHNSDTSQPSIPISTFLDTGAQVTVMTFKAAKRAGIAHLIDGRYSGHACGVGGASCRVLGRIPANTVSFIIAGHGESEGCVIEKSPAITVLEDRMLGGDNGDKVEMLLGLDALEDWHALICLRDKTLTVRNGVGKSTLGGRRHHRSSKGETNIVIPFMGTRIIPDISETSYRTSSNSSVSARSRRTTQQSTMHQSSRGRSSIYQVNASELEAELDSLDEKKPPKRKEWREELNEFMSDGDIGLIEDEDDDDNYFESDVEYDGFDLSGI